MCHFETGAKFRPQQPTSIALNDRPEGPLNMDMPYSLSIFILPLLIPWYNKPVVQPEFLCFSASYIPIFSYIATIPSLSAPSPFNQEKSAFFKPTYAAPSTPKHTPQLPIPVKTILFNLCLLKNVLAGFAYLPSHKATA